MRGSIDGGGGNCRKTREEDSPIKFGRPYGKWERDRLYGIVVDLASQLNVEGERKLGVASFEITKFAIRQKDYCGGPWQDA
jgi:hypothetical protein